MTQAHTTHILTLLPHEGFRALEKAVTGRFDWRILTGKNDNQPRFVIEKQVRYNLMRGAHMYAIFRVTGSFQKTKSGDTALQYTVSGQSGAPLLQAVVNILVLLFVAFLLATLVFSPDIRGNWIGVALVAAVLLATLLYGWWAYRNYQGHLKEMSQFMEAFAERHARA